jgi:hypothetical protein
MVINDLDVISFAISPAKADPPLIVDPNAVLTPTVAVQFFESVAGRHFEIVEPLCGIDGQELSSGAPLDLQGQVPNSVASEDGCGALVGEALDHDLTYRGTVRHIKGFVPRNGTSQSALSH